jgi:hypothetical protein
MDASQKQQCGVTMPVQAMTGTGKTGKAQCEQMFSAVHPITDIAKILRYVGFVPISATKSATNGNPQARMSTFMLALWMAAVPALFHKAGESIMRPTESIGGLHDIQSSKYCPNQIAGSLPDRAPTSQGLQDGNRDTGEA